MVSENYIRHSEASRNRIQSCAFVISVFGCALLCTGFAVSSFETRQLDIIELDERVNPNEAPVSSLVRLPGIGISRAEAIVAYRNNFNQADGNSRAFGHCDDLQKIKGIGPKTVQNICEWLTFE